MRAAAKEGHHQRANVKTAKTAELRLKAARAIEFTGEVLRTDAERELRQERRRTRQFAKLPAGAARRSAEARTARQGQRQTVEPQEAK